MASDNTNFAGIQVDANDLSAVRPGSVQDSQNVTTARPGVLEPRPGFRDGFGVFDGGTYGDIPLRSFKHTDQTIYHATATPSSTGHTPTVVGITDGDVCLYEEDGSTMQMFVNSGGIELGDNFYFCSTAGLRKIVNIDDGPSTWSPWYPARSILVDTFGYSVSSEQGWADPTKYGGTTVYMTYVVTLVFTDDNGVVHETSPTHPVVYGTSTQASIPRVTVEFPITLNLDPARVKVRLYRSFYGANRVVDNATYLAQEKDYEVPSTGYMTFLDTVHEEKLAGSTPLYCGTQNGGLVEAHYPPRIAKCAASYRGSLIVGNLQDPKNIIIDSPQPLAFPDGDYGDYDDSEFLGGIDVAGCVLASGETYVSVPSEMSILTSIKPGHMVVPNTSSQFATGSDWGANVAFVTSIGSVVGSVMRVNIDRECAASGTLLCSFIDTVLIQSSSDNRTWIPMGVPDDASAKTVFGAAEPPSDPSFAIELLNVVQPNGTPMADLQGWWRWAGARRLRAVHVKPWDGLTYYVSATNGSRHYPEIADTPSDLTLSGDPLESDLLPAALQPSRADEPENFRGIDDYFVGDVGGEIMNMVEAGEYLYISKDRDGIWIMSGYGYLSGFTITQVSRDHKVMGHQFACGVGDGCAYWTNRGVVLATGENLQDLTDTRMATQLEAYPYDPAFPYIGSMYFDPVRQELHFIFGNYDDKVTNWWVYNTTAQSWHKWTLPALHDGDVPSSSWPLTGPVTAFPALYGDRVSVMDSYRRVREQPSTVPDEMLRYCDYVAAITITAVSDTGNDTYNLTFSGVWNYLLEPGHSIWTENGRHYITAEDTVSYNCDTYAPGLTSASVPSVAYLCAPIDSWVQFHPFTDPDYSSSKRWQDLVFQFGRGRGPHYFEAHYYTADNETPREHTIATKSVTNTIWTGAGANYRLPISLEYVQSELLYVKFRVNEAAAPWRLHAVSAFGVATGRTAN